MMGSMATRQDGSRPTATQRRAHARSVTLAGRLGAALREARRASGRLQRDASVEAGVSQPRFSELERGLGASASLATWTAAAEAIGEQLVAFLEHVPGASLPRDYQHLRRQQLVVGLAHRGGWRPMPEHPVDADAFRSRSIDVFLTRVGRCEAVVVEIWDWFNDVGAAMRGLDDKIAAVRRSLGPEGDDPDAPWSISGLWVVRGTQRNRQLVRELGNLFAAKFPGSARAWLGAPLGIRQPPCPLALASCGPTSPVPG
jgi:transcriptional regulator with XRE-family HTH domain